jgi:hypothetical protein
MQRRTLLLRAGPVLAFASTAAWPLAASAAAPMVEIWKDPNCGCCQDWVKHLNKNGFATRVHDERQHRRAHSVGRAGQAGLVPHRPRRRLCLEGHVPAREVHRRLLKEKPKAVGLAVPGMPVGSPGMDGPAYGDQRDPYDVLLVLADGSSRVYQSYR